MHAYIEVGITETASDMITSFDLKSRKAWSLIDDSANGGFTPEVIELRLEA